MDTNALYDLVEYNDQQSGGYARAIRALLSVHHGKGRIVIPYAVEEELDMHNHLPPPEKRTEASERKQRLSREAWHNTDSILKEAERLCQDEKDMSLNLKYDFIEFQTSSNHEDLVHKHPTLQPNSAPNGAAKNRRSDNAILQFALERQRAQTGWIGVVTSDKNLHARCRREGVPVMWTPKKEWANRHSETNYFFTWEQKFHNKTASCVNVFTDHGKEE